MIAVLAKKLAAQMQNDEGKTRGRSKVLGRGDVGHRPDPLGGHPDLELSDER